MENKTQTLKDISLACPLVNSLFILLFHNSAAKKKVELQVVHIYFDTSTFDRVEKDVKVILEDDLFLQLPIKGDPGGSVGFDWRHNGTLHWLLNPQWN